MNRRDLFAALGGAVAGAVLAVTGAKAKANPAPIATDSLYPVGSLMMWNGAYTTVPDGWAWCDGKNGTCDLRGRFAYSIHEDALFCGQPSVPAYVSVGYIQRVR